MTELTSGNIFAYLSSSWVNINSDIQAANVSCDWGIRGNKPTDLLADPGGFRFTLSNRTGQYSPDSTGALAGWGKGTPVKMELTFDGETYIRAYGRVDTISMRNSASVNDNFVDVIALDWLDYANKYPVVSPQALSEIRANQALNTIIAAMPIQPQGINFASGLETFPAVFDSTTIDTRAYTEFSKLTKSEYGYLYIRKEKDTGGTLTFEANDTRNGLRTLKTIPIVSADSGFLLMETGDHLLQETGDKILLNQAQDASITSGIIDASLRYGDAIVNRVTVQAFPKRLDTEDTILYSLSSPMPIATEETITFRAQYTDPTGGNRVNASNGTMITPVVNGTADPNLASLLHFNGADVSTTFTDETGKTWTAYNGAIIINSTASISKLGGGCGQFSGTNEYIDTPSHADFEFGSGDFTVEWYAYIRDPASGDCTLARDGLSNYPAWAFGFSDGVDLDVYLTSTGTSWDAMYPRTLGKISQNTWVHYAISRDGNIFRTFRDGQLIDTWIDPITLVTSTGSPCVGRVNNTKYQFVNVDELRIEKGKALYKRNFTPPSIQYTGLLEGDYLANTLDDGSGTDLTSDIVISATYGSEAVVYTIQNTSAYDGFITLLQARGRGIYQYNPVELSLTDSVSIADYGYQDVKIDQQYQRDLIAGRRHAGQLLDTGKQPHTNLRSITLSANRSSADMQLFLTADIGDLIQITETNTGIDSRYYIQAMNFSVSPGGMIKYTLGVKQAWSLGHGLTGMTLEMNGSGTTDAVSFGSIPQMSNLRYLTASAWIYVTNLVTPNTIFAYYSDYAGLNFYVAASGKLVYYQKGTSGPGAWNTNGTVSTDAWHHVAVTRDTLLPGNQAKFYIDGAVAASVVALTQTGAIQDDSMCDMLIGNTKTVTQDYPSPLYGSIKDLRIYNVIKTAAQVAALNTAGAYEMSDTAGMVFQAPTVRTKELTYWTDHTLLTGDRIIDNVFGNVGAAHGSPIIRSST